MWGKGGGAPTSDGKKCDVGLCPSTNSAYIRSPVFGAITLSAEKLLLPPSCQ